MKMVLREGDQTEIPQGTRYKLRLSLEEDI
jgi:hypothetical protein